MQQQVSPPDFASRSLRQAKTPVRFTTLFYQIDS